VLVCFGQPILCYKSSENSDLLEIHRGPALTAHGSLDLKQEIQIQTGNPSKRALLCGLP
jgi:hypothetical protein